MKPFIGLIALLGFAVSLVTGNAAPQRIPVKDKEVKASNNGAANANLTHKRGNKVPTEKQVHIQPAPATQRKEEQKNTQKDGWDWAEIISRAVNLANLGVFVLGLVGLYFVWRTLRATEVSNEQTAESNRIARESAEFAQRAWLAIVEVSGTASGTDESLTIVYKNTGNMPAVNITFSAVGQIRRDVFEEYGTWRLTEAEAAEKPGIVVTGTRISSERCLGNGERGEYSIFVITPDCLRDPHPAVVIEVTARYFDIFQKERTTISQHRIYSPAVREWVTMTAKMT